MKSARWRVLPAAVFLVSLLVAGLSGSACAQLTDDDQNPTTPEARKPATSDVNAPATPTGIPAVTNREELRRTLGTASQVTLAGSVDPDVYRVGPGDLIQVSVSGGISRSIPLEVGPEGTVLLPTSGTMTVDGLTLREARERIIARLKPEFRNVSIDVRLLRPRTFIVYVTGQVKDPGTYQANGGTRAADIVLQADPLERGSLRQIQVMHRDGTKEPVDLELFIRTADQSLNPWLRDGDILQVPSITQGVSIQGAVSRPGRFELGPRDSLRTLLALGGGLAPSADSTRALLVRWTAPTQSESIWVQIPQVLAGTYNPPLQQGDHLYVYFVPMFQVSNEAQILGQVDRPGMYPIKLGHDRLSDLVRAAGGFLPSADLASIRVRRTSPTKAEEDPELQRLVRLSRSQLTNYEYDVLNTKLASQREEYRIDWNKVTSTPSLDVLLVNGDIVDVEPLVNSIRIDGQVRRPGILTFSPGKKVEDYVQVAGGFSERAWQSRIRVTRSVTGQTLLARDVQKLDPGDFIWVPERPDVTFWQQAQVLLTAAAEVATVVLAFHAIHP